MNKKESLLAETISWVLQNPQSINIFTELKKALDTYEIEQNYWQPLFDLMYNEHGLTLLESEMKDIVYVVKKMEAPTSIITNSYFSEINLKDLQSVLHNVQNVMAGYSQDDTWSDYDKKSHAELIEMQYIVEDKIKNVQPPNDMQCGVGEKNRN